jgi:hypothetical protein
MDFLTKFIPGGWLLYTILAAVIFSGGFFAGSKFRSSVDAPIIAKAQEVTAAALVDVARERTALSDQLKQIALDAQKVSEQALTIQRAQDAQIADLTSKLAMTEKARQAASTRFLDSLKAEPKNEQVTLSPAVKQYLADVRTSQMRNAP